MKKKGWFFAFFLLLGGRALQGEAPLRIVGSSAVFPFAATAAEHFSYKTQEPIPLVEANGTGAGVKLFCEGPQGPDIAMTSRPLTAKEIKKCREQGVDFQEFKIGQDGLVLIKRKGAEVFSLTLKELRETLAEKVSVGSTCLKNLHHSWAQIRGVLPKTPLHILGPAPASGTYDVLVEKIKGPCGSQLRHDGVYVEAPANENLIVQKILNSQDTVGIITFSFYDKNKHRLSALPVEGVAPSFLTLQNGTYPLGRPLYIYVKLNDLNHHADRALYVMEVTSQDAVNYLREKGLVPLPFAEQEELHGQAQRLLQKSVSLWIPAFAGMTARVRHCEPPEGARQSQADCFIPSLLAMMASFEVSPRKRGFSTYPRGIS